MDWISAAQWLDEAGGSVMSITALELTQDEIGRHDEAAARERRERLWRGAAPQPVKTPVSRRFYVPVEFTSGERPLRKQHVNDADVYPVPVGPSRPLRDGVPFPRIKLRSLLNIVAHVYGIRIDDILSSRRSIDLTRPRQEGMWLAKQYTRYSYPEIGKAFNRDHTTALHGARKIEQLIKSEGYKPQAEPFVADWLAYMAEREKMRPPPPPVPPRVQFVPMPEKFWTVPKQEKLRALLHSGKSRRQAADAMGLSYSSVKAAALRYKLDPPAIAAEG